MKQVITFDIDNVVFSTNGLAADIISSYGLTPRFHDWNFNWLPERVRSSLDKIYYSEDIKNGHLTSRALPEYIHTLSQDYDIVFVSARPVKLLNATMEQFSQNKINISRDQLILLDKCNKAGVLKNLKTVLHIDDSDAVIKLCIEHDINHCMISNEMTEFNYYLRKHPKVRWAHNLDGFWENRNAFINYPMTGHGVKQR